MKKFIIESIVDVFMFFTAAFAILFGVYFMTELAESLAIILFVLTIVLLYERLVRDKIQNFVASRFDTVDDDTDVITSCLCRLNSLNFNGTDIHELHLKSIILLRDYKTYKFYNKEICMDENLSVSLENLQSGFDTYAIYRKMKNQKLDVDDFLKKNIESAYERLYLKLWHLMLVNTSLDDKSLYDFQYE